MDDALSKLSRKKAIDALNKTMLRFFDDANLVTLEENSIFISIPRESDKFYFLLRVDLPDTFPLEPGDYYFVNPKNKTEPGSQFWPSDGDDSLKIKNQNPPWICISGTSAYKFHHKKYDLKTNTLAQIVIHIYRQINGVKKIA